MWFHVNVLPLASQDKSVFNDFLSNPHSFLISNSTHLDADVDDDANAFVFDVPFDVKSTKLIPNLSSAERHRVENISC